MLWMLTLLGGLTVAQADEADDVVARLKAWKAHRKADSVPSIPTSIYREALGGDIAKGIEFVEEVKAAKGYAVAVFDIPIAQLWRAVTDKDHHANQLPVQISRTVEGQPRTHDHTIFQYLEVPLFTDRWWLVNITYNAALYTASEGKAWELVWRDRNQDAALKAKLDPETLEDGMPVAWTKGAWLLVDIGKGRTLIEYHTWSDPGGSVPVGPATRLAAREVVSTLEGIARFAQTHTPTCKGRYTRPDGSAQ